MNVVKDNDIDFFIVQLLMINDREWVIEFLSVYFEMVVQEFRDEYEKGYYIVWVEFLKVYLNQKMFV